MAQVLYRKYRSKNLSEVVGQPHIVKTLNEALKSGRISHAYLLTGPRGVGKTSVARILAHEINNIPYEDDQAHIDIIEIDAASNRRIDEIRDLREKVHTMPASAKYKVYIIDEVHMLTKEAFNALLKTLEEPPAHVIFILATTDPHKLPDTIISRTQRFSFKPIENADVVSHLKNIAGKEKVKINDEALELIAEHGQGSFRDSISLLDQLSHSAKEVTAEDVRHILGIPSSQAISQLIDLLDNPETTYKQLSTKLKELQDQGFSPMLLAASLMDELRDRLIDNRLGMSASKALAILKELLIVSSSQDPSSYLLLALLATLDPLKPNQPTATANKPDEPAQPMVKEVSEPVPEPELKSENPKTTKIAPKSNLEPEALWSAVLNELKAHYNTLYGIVRMAEPVFKDDSLDLMFDFAFHQKQVSESKNKHLISKVLTELTGKNYNINCHLSERPKNETPQTNSDLDNIVSIFGGGEVVD